MAIENVSARDAADIMRKALQATYCMDFDIFVDVMNNGVADTYAEEKWRLMQRNVTLWFCDLDSSNAQKFLTYVINK